MKLNAIYLLIILALVFIFVPVSYAKTCEECPSHNPCSYTYMEQCNTCVGATWCVNDQWYTDGYSMCTSMACIGYGYKIDNPYQNEKLN